MRGSLAKLLRFSLILAGLAIPAFAQNSTGASSRASFLPSGVGDIPSESTFSGLATGQPASVLPPPSAPALTPAPAASPSGTGKAADLAIEPVSVAPLPSVSLESVGTKNPDGLGADMWKGTSHVVAEHLLPLLSPSSSPVLNGLTRRLLTTAAIPPEGEAGAAQTLTSARAEKLALFGDAADAWSLVRYADVSLIDNATFHLVAESALINGDETLCGQAPDLAKAHTGPDWQELLIVCQLRTKDTKAAQVGMDVFRASGSRDNVFLSIADKNILGGDKMLPTQLTPLMPETLALLQMANLPLPVSLYPRADLANASALLRIPAQQDVAQLALAERALSRGMISAADLGAIYRATNFSPDALASPLSSGESGLRLRALLFRAAEGEKTPGARIALVVKFVQSAAPDFLNGAGSLIAAMLGDIKADPTLAGSAATVARVYMLAGKGDAALEWLRLAQSSSVSAEGLQMLWPQFALAGLEAENAYAADFGKWLDAALKNADAQTLHDIVAPTLLLLDAGGMVVPDTVWAKVLKDTQNERKVAFSPLLFERMQAAAAANRRAEMVLLAVALAGDGDISLPATLGITAALRQAGFKSEAAVFAQEAVALLAKGN